MIVTGFTKRALASRREDLKMKRLGYRRHETDWEIHRGHSMGKVIVDAKVSENGLYVWTLLGEPGPASD